MEKSLMRASQLPAAQDLPARERPQARGPANGPLVLGRYRLHRQLGAGGFGTVWLAHDERLDRAVAVKIVPRERIVGGRFEREARAAARLAHAGIVTLYEAGADDDGAYLVSELVRGATLAALLDAGRLSDRDVLQIGIALCDALAHAHSMGVVHRDVKPSNVLIPERAPATAPVAKLTDFGVARVLGGDSLTQTGDVIGTAAYMAPEQAEGREAGTTADLYSLALVLYEALTGVNPRRTGTAAQRARRLGAYVPALRRQRRDLPRELGQGIDRALRPRPRERGTIDGLRGSLIASLASVADEPGVVTSPWPTRAEPQVDAARSRHVGLEPAPPIDPPIDPPPEPAPETPRPPLALAARAAAALATAALAAWLASHMLHPSPVPPALAAVGAGAVVGLLPRIGWLALATTLVTTLALGHRPGAALVLGLAALVPLLVMPLAGWAWGVSAAAPGLAALGLAGAWPALAARLGNPWRRAALGFTGWLWLAIAEPLTGAHLYLGSAPGTPPPAVWTKSLHRALHDVLGPMLSSGALAPSLVWALAAVALPWLVRGRSPALDVVRVVVWSATLVSATTAAITLATGSSSHGTLRGAVLGALAGVAIALVPTAVGLRRQGRQRRATQPRFP